MDYSNSAKGNPVPEQNASELDEVFDELEATIVALEKNVESDELQCNVCLLTRSAFTDFYSVSVLQNKADQMASERLRGLLNSALAKLPKDSKYRASVQARFDDFDAFCKDLALRNEFDTAVFDVTV